MRDGGGGENGTERADTDAWTRVGPDALGALLNNARRDANDAVRELVGALDEGHAPTADELRRARIQLNWERTIVETMVAPVAGVEPWSDPTPPIPHRVAHEWVCGDREGRNSGEDRIK